MKPLEKLNRRDYVLNVHATNLVHRSIVKSWRCDCQRMFAILMARLHANTISESIQKYCLEIVQVTARATLKKVSEKHTARVWAS